MTIVHCLNLGIFGKRQKCRWALLRAQDQELCLHSWAECVGMLHFHPCKLPKWLIPSISGSHLVLGKAFNMHFWVNITYSSMSECQRAPPGGFGNQKSYSWVTLKDSLHFAYLTLLLHVFILMGLEYQQAQPATVRALVPTSARNNKTLWDFPSTSLHSAERNCGSFSPSAHSPWAGAEPWAFTHLFQVNELLGGNGRIKHIHFSIKGEMSLRSSCKPHQKQV